MIEIFQIFLQILVIFIFCYFPQYYLNFLNIRQQSIVEKISLGSIINIFILLLLSFINQKNFDLIFVVLIIVFCTNLFFFIIENWKLKQIDIKLIFLFIFVLVFSFDLANNLKLGWDAQNFWFLKTLNFIEGGDIYNLKNNPRQEYPQLGTFIWAIYTKISFLEYEYLGRIFYIFFFCLSIFSVAELLDFNNVYKILFSSIIIILTYNILLFNGYQEVLIFSIFTLFSKYLYLIIKNNISKNLLNFYSIMMMLLLLSSIWIKNEAMFFSFISIFLILCLPKKSFLFKLSIIFSFILLIILRFFIFKTIGLSNILQPGNYEYSDILRLFSFISLDRILVTSKYFFFGLASNLLYVISISIMLFLFVYKKNKIDLTYYFASLILNFLLIHSFYIFTSVPIEWHLKISIERILFEVLGIYIIPIVIFTNVYSKKIFKI